MKKLLKNVFIFIVTVSICFGVIVIFDIFVIGSPYKYSYQASLLDKLNRLESLDDPKIILVGNSNVSFGIHSKKLEDAMGMPVVNLGLHGGLGNAFHEEIAKRNINEGDIVIVCHSSFSDSDEIEDLALAWVTIDNHREIWKIIRKKDYGALFKAYPNYLRNSIFRWLLHKGNKDSGDSYSRNALNEYGDVIYKPKEKRANFTESEIVMPEINNICVDRLNEYNDYITSRGALLLVAGYPILSGEYTASDEQAFRVFEERLKNALNCEVISDYTDYFYPYDYFYDTMYHLTNEGAEIRTDQLISDLKNYGGAP